MGIRRKNRRQIGKSQPQGSYPKFLVVAGTPVPSGPAYLFPVYEATEAGGVSSRAPYTGQLAVKAQSPTPGNDASAAVNSIAADNGGPGGQARIQLEIPAGLTGGDAIFWPANWEAVRGQNGEWIAASTFLMP